MPDKDVYLDNDIAAGTKDVWLYPEGSHGGATIFAVSGTITQGESLVGTPQFVFSEGATVIEGADLLGGGGQAYGAAGTTTQGEDFQGSVLFISSEGGQVIEGGDLSGGWQVTFSGDGRVIEGNDLLGDQETGGAAVAPTVPYDNPARFNSTRTARVSVAIFPAMGTKFRPEANGGSSTVKLD